MIDRPDWSTQQPGTTLVPAASTEPPERHLTRPDWGPAPETTSRNERHINAAAHAQWRDGQRSSDEIVDIDEQDAARYRKLLSDGIFTPEELARHYGLTDAELDALENPAKPLTRASIDRELAEIADLRRKDRRAYFKDEALQQRERELIERRNRTQAAKDEAREWGDGSGLDPELLAQWEKQGSVAAHLGKVQATVGAMIDALEPEDADALQESFDGLPQGTQNAVYSFLALDGGNWRPATDAAVKTFGETPEGAELVAEWGGKAATRVASVRARMGMILGAMTAEDRSKASAWFDGLPAAQAKAVLKALAGG